MQDPQNLQANGRKGPGHIVNLGRRLKFIRQILILHCMLIPMGCEWLADVVPGDVLVQNQSSTEIDVTFVYTDEEVTYRLQPGHGLFVDKKQEKRRPLRYDITRADQNWTMTRDQIEEKLRSDRVETVALVVTDETVELDTISGKSRRVIYFSGRFGHVALLHLSLHRMRRKSTEHPCTGILLRTFSVARIMSVSLERRRASSLKRYQYLRT